MTAYPTLTCPKRVYPPNGEAVLFDLQRIFDYLATLTFTWRISRQGHLNINRTAYFMGRAHVKKIVLVRCDPATREWVVSEQPPPAAAPSPQPLKRFPIKNLDTQTLVGHELPPPTLAQPLQLVLPGLVPPQRGH